jgi:hypothetical protein
MLTPPELAPRIRRVRNAEIRRIAAEIDPTISIAEVQSLEDALVQSIADQKRLVQNG